MAERKPKFTTAPSAPAHQAPAFEAADIYAIKALFEGKATEQQQLRFLQWFDKATGANQNPFRPGGADAARDTDVACGRKFVADWFYAIVQARVIQE